MGLQGVLSILDPLLQFLKWPLRRFQGSFRNFSGHEEILEGDLKVSGVFEEVLGLPEEALVVLGELQAFLWVVERFLKSLRGLRRDRSIYKGV